MEKVLEVAMRVSTPIAVAGLVVGVLLIIFYAILKLKIFPRLNQTMGKDLLASMMKYLYRLALVSIVLGFIAYLAPIVLGAVFPAKRMPPDSAQWQMKFDYTLKDAIYHAAKLDDHPAVRFEKCDEAVMNIKVNKGTYTGKNYSDIIKQLQFNLAEPATREIYQVRLSEEGYYEILCHN
jgi:hypothetical protein